MHYDHTALPHDYFNEAPRDLSQLETNMSVLAHCAQDLLHPGSAIATSLIKPFVSEMWTHHLDPLRAEMLAAQQVLLSVGGSSSAGGVHSGAAAQEGADCVRKELKELALDIAHLDEMRRLDHHGLDGAAAEMDPSKRQRLSDVVPMSGLVAGYLHRLLQEHRTAVSVWSKRKPR